jgi:hypothetical protein
MSAAEALRVAHAAGVTVTLDGDGLLLEAKAEPPPAVLDSLAHHKVAILALLGPGQGGWTTQHWRAYFAKRSRTAASRNALPQAEAEALAFDYCVIGVIEWLNRHPDPSAQGRCAWCGRPELPGAVVLPFGTEPGMHAWLHAECWPTWHQARRADAIAALLAMGIHE